MSAYWIEIPQTKHSHLIGTIPNVMFQDHDPVGAMRPLQLDENADANTVVAEYTRTTLDHRHNTWDKVCEQIDNIMKQVKETVDVEIVKQLIRKMHVQEGLDNKILIVVYYKYYCFDV